MTHTAQPHLVLCELTDPGLPGVETYSPFCLKAHRALRAAGLTYERRHALRPDAFRAWNPTGQVPVLLIDGEPVADSTRILHRIAAFNPSWVRDLAPQPQAEAWLWEEFADTAVNAHLVSARWADARNWPLTRDALFAEAPWIVRRVVAPRVRKNILRALVARDILRAGWQACWSRYLTLLDQLEARAPEDGFWIGTGLTVADVGLFGQLHSFRTPLTRPQAEELAQRPKLSAYLNRVDIATREPRVAGT
ncbi:MAG: glutathione S-transferase N-terminal domain-containing protein [Polyangiales bacterium]